MGGPAARPREGRTEVRKAGIRRIHGPSALTGPRRTAHGGGVEAVLTHDVTARARRSPEFEADLVRLRQAVENWQENSFTAPTNRAEMWLLPRVLGYRYSQVHTVRQALLVASLTAAVHLAAPVVVTTVARRWSDAPFWTWVGAAVLLGTLDVFGTRVHSESSATGERLFELPAAIDRDSDLHSLLELTRRWWRVRTVAPAALVLALSILAMSAAATPDSFRSFHPGSLVMLALLVHEFVENQLMVFVALRVFVWESRFVHRLSWLDPLASPPIQATLHTWFASIGAGSPMLVVFGVAVTIIIAPVAPNLLLVPLAGMSLIGLVLTLTSLITLRRSVQRIVQRTKDAALESLRGRIEALEPHTRDLTSHESARLRALLATYAAVRDAPTAPSRAQTIGRAVSALAIPALAFFLAVMAEVYAERLLDQLLP